MVARFTEWPGRRLGRENAPPPHVPPVTPRRRRAGIRVRAGDSARDGDLGRAAAGVDQRTALRIRLGAGRRDRSAPAASAHVLRFLGLLSSYSILFGPRRRQLAIGWPTFHSAADGAGGLKKWGGGQVAVAVDDEAGQSRGVQWRAATPVPVESNRARGVWLPSGPRVGMATSTVSSYVRGEWISGPFQAGRQIVLVQRCKGFCFCFERNGRIRTKHDF